MLFKIWALSVFFASRATATACNHDNCLRALRATSPTVQYQSAVSFCSTFTAGPTPITATAAVPSIFATPCADSVARLSSACSCMPTPIPAPAGCQSLILNGDWTDGPVQEVGTDPPYWTITYENNGNSVFYEVQNFGSGPVFWTKFENDYPVEPTQEVYINIAQGFERCVGIAYQLSVRYNLDSYADKQEYPNSLPLTFQVSVGFGNGSTPTVTRTQVYTESQPYDGGTILMLFDALAVAPTPGTDGLSITLSDSFGGDMELYLDDITMVAVSS